MPLDLYSPTAPPEPLVRIVPCAGVVVVEWLDATHDLERRSDGSERVVLVIRADRRSD